MDACAPPVSAIFRFPVKAMGGEALSVAELDARGLVGDRGWALHERADGRLSTGKNGPRFRRRDGVFDLVARLGPAPDPPRVVLADGRVVVAGEPPADAALSAHLGADVELRPEGESGAHFDAEPVSIVGTATLAAAGALAGADGPLDPRRFRANLVVETSEPYVEESWLGATLAVGTCRLQVTTRVERCRMVDVDQVGVDARDAVLRALGESRQACLAVYARVVTPGRVGVGDLVAVEPPV